MEQKSLGLKETLEEQMTFMILSTMESHLTISSQVRHTPSNSTHSCKTNPSSWYILGSPNPPIGNLVRHIPSSFSQSFLFSFISISCTSSSSSSSSSSSTTSTDNSTTTQIICYGGWFRNHPHLIGQWNFLDFKNFWNT